MAVLSPTVSTNVANLGGGVKVMGPCAAAGDIFYPGAILFSAKIEASSPTGKINALPTSGILERFAGICSKLQTTTAADQLVEYYVGGVWLFPAIAAVSSADIGSWLICDKDGTLSDNPADLVSSNDVTKTTGDAVIGRIVGMDASSNIVVDCGCGGGLLLTSTSFALY